jgi:hypothetical protein
MAKWMESEEMMRIVFGMGSFGAVVESWKLHEDVMIGNNQLKLPPFEYLVI